LGNKSREGDKKIAMETAKEYVEVAPKDRGRIEAFVVSEGSEPLEFVSHFHVWNEEISKAKIYFQ
jgi:hypothetical protein